MNNATLLAEISRLPSEEQLELAGDIRSRLSPPEADDLREEMRAELDRRAAEHERDPSSAVPSEEAIARLKTKFALG